LRDNRGKIVGMIVFITISSSGLNTSSVLFEVFALEGGRLRDNRGKIVWNDRFYYHFKFWRNTLECSFFRRRLWLWPGVIR
jgi:hypothetical protein